MHIFDCSAIEAAQGRKPQAVEAPVAAATANVERAISANAGLRAQRRIGKLTAYRPKPRRLDKRILTRRPLMLVKRRPWAPPPTGRVTGREIIARN